MKGFTRAAKLLEFDKVLAYVSAGAATEGAKEAILALTPTDDIVIVSRLQGETRDAKQMIIKKSQKKVRKLHKNMRIYSELYDIMNI